MHAYFLLSFRVWIRLCISAQAVRCRVAVNAERVRFSVSEYLFDFARAPFYRDSPPRIVSLRSSQLVGIPVVGHERTGVAALPVSAPSSAFDFRPRDIL